MSSIPEYMTAKHRECDDYFSEAEVDVLGIGSLFNVSASTVKEISERCRRVSSKTKAEIPRSCKCTLLCK